MVAMSVRDHRTVDGSPRIDGEIARGAVQTAFRVPQQRFGHDLSVVAFSPRTWRPDAGVRLQFSATAGEMARPALTSSLTCAAESTGATHSFIEFVGFLHFTACDGGNHHLGDPHARL